MLKQSAAMPRRSSLGRMVNQSTMLLMVTIGSLILILALMILFHQNANATKGYLLRSLNVERKALLHQEELVKMELAQEQSLQTLQTDKQVEAMITPRSVKYSKEYPTLATK